MVRFIGLAVLVILCTYSEAQRYEITPIKGPEGRPATVSDLNDSGQVVGWWRNAGGYDRAFFWEKGVVSDLGGFGGNISRAMSINNAGTVVGFSEDAAGARHAFVWTKQQGLRPLFSGRGPGTAMSINEAGDIVAYGNRSAYLVSGGTITVLPNRFPNGWSYVTDINDAGQIVGGDYKYQSEFPLPTTWIKGAAYGLAGGFSSLPTRINKGGQVAGYTSPGWNLGVPVTWINRQITYLPMLAYGGQARDVDDSGLVVGHLYDDSYTSHAVAWRHLQIVHLNDEKLAAAGWHLSSANAINEKGQIAGWGTYGQTSTSYLLTPDPRGGR